MNKKLIVLIMISIFLIACSNTKVQVQFSDIQIEHLENFNRELKENLSNNNIEYIKENTDKSIANKHIINEIEKIDFSNVNIFISKPVFTEEKPISILALNMDDNTFYFELIYNYDYHSKRWLIYKVKERG
ncbi:MAG: hypothetical protein SOY60_03290 [Fusobacterium gastrosuis]|uniref:hypothetical protein n=1 Tax=Fusobacterium TaxID=848 RepID=UPI001F50306D|nr:MULTISPECIES: hypothetical protein [Fusobacterium]MDD7392724.1 hypothetical protein [Fusobacteriaceae bacterium]MCI5724916.1 hypothetical protein [Fusobacterium sp.]MDD7409718.1 hypothetical protein [Fusobacteriaceae bacterium]MDY4010673.1 hypothetical protein [Fusobacterium gastrosuis]MDY5305734.1 hypothetical protein [Fusobacterium gastrosuis]